MENLHPPFLVGGDFNGRHITWDKTSNFMGETIFNWAADYEMTPLNDGSITRFSPSRENQDTSIDVTFASTSILERLKWSIHSDPFNSDHLPIFVKLDGNCAKLPVIKKWKIKEANWEKYQEEISDELLSIVEPNINNITKTIYETAKRSIPRTSGNTAPKYAPWWTEEINDKIKSRKENWKILRKTLKTDENWAERNENFRKARAVAKEAVQKAKKDAWIEFASSFNIHTPASLMWQRFGKITGKKTGRTITLTINGEYTEDPLEIANHIADNFQDNFTHNYPDQNMCQLPPSISVNETLDTDFSGAELNSALSKCAGKATGPDDVTYSMITNMPPIAKRIILKFFNVLWQKGDYPAEWRESRIIPIPKPGEVVSFRPIALTSCIAKIYERMINRRIQHYLEENNILHRNQHAFRSGRGTTSYLSQLKDILTEHRHENKHSELVSLDLSKAFDRTWRQGILQALIKSKIGNRTYQMVRNFLKDRTFRVGVSGALSSARQQETGVPQGSVISPTLFLLVINGVFESIPRCTTVLIYADDILLICGSKFSAICRKNLQKGIDATIRWAEKNGFSINAEKSSLLHTCSGTKGRHYFYRLKALTANGTEILRKRNMRILGVSINQKGNANSHIKTLQKDCEIRNRFLKIISRYGSRETLLKIGFATVISKLFYGWECFEPQEILKLKTIYHNMLRTASGAFYTTPISALYVENGVLPFEYLAAENWTRKATWIAERVNFNENYILNRANVLLEGITNHKIPPVLKLQSENAKIWNDNLPKIDWTIKNRFKTGGNKKSATAMYIHLKNTEYRCSKKIYTDGSLANGKVGIGIFHEADENIASQLPNSYSIFSAEALAIQMAVQIANRSTAIFTDSASVLSALESGVKHPIIQSILKHKNLKHVTLVWIPSHIGIVGNEQADRLANLGRDGEIIQIKTPKADAQKWVRQILWRSHGQKWWNEQDTALREIKSITGKWTDVKSRKEQRILTRLRTGHTRLTHGHILEAKEEPTCSSCGVVITVKHLLTDCRKYSTQRQNFEIEGGLEKILENNKDSEKKLIEFLKNSALYSEI